MAAETKPHGSWKEPEFLEPANLAERPSVKGPGFAGEESAAHVLPFAVVSILNPFLLDSLALWY